MLDILILGLVPFKGLNTEPRPGAYARGHGVGVWARQSTINNIIVSGEAILSAENSEKPLGGLATPRTLLGELSAFPRPLAGGERVAATHQEPHPALDLLPNEKSWARP